MARLNQGDLRVAFGLMRYQLEAIQRALTVLEKALDSLDELVEPSRSKAADDGKS